MKGFSMRKIAIALVAATALFAADSAYKYELTPTIGGVHPEGNLGVNEQSAIGLRIGRNLENFFLDHVELGVSHTNKIREYGVDGKATRYFVNAIKDFGLTEKLSLYGLLGAGYEDVSKRFVKNDDGGFGEGCGPLAGGGGWGVCGGAPAKCCATPIRAALVPGCGPKSWKGIMC